jgi:hypothetical protein
MILPQIPWKRFPGTRALKLKQFNFSLRGHSPRELYHRSLYRDPRHPLLSLVGQNPRPSPHSSQCSDFVGSKFFVFAR